jgi:hypothetical protein
MTRTWPALGLISAALAAVALMWGVTSWRLSGPALRVHCLAYRSVIVVRVFNAGRIADSVEHIVIGGMSGGRGGFDLTEALALPIRLDPGEARRWRLDPAATELTSHARRIRDGWASLWILTGSMRRHRVEIMPVGTDSPPKVGWQLVPRRTRFTRYLPAVGAAAAFLAASLPTQTWVVVAVALIGLLVVVRGVVASGSARAFPRQRVERWALALIWVACLVLLARGVDRPAGAPVPAADIALIGASSVVAFVIAKPGAASHVLDSTVILREWCASARTRMRKRAHRFVRPNIRG